MSQISVLIVEDEGIVALDLANKLRRLGYRSVGSTSRGHKAVLLARERRPDVVLMDISLADAMDGIAAAEQIQRELDVPVVYVTAHSDQATLKRAKRTEPFGFLLKPFDERELKVCLEMALYKHEADRRLRESEEKFRCAFANAAIGFAMTTQDGRFVDANSAFCQLTGYGLEELRELESVQLVHPDDAAENVRLVGRMLAGELKDFTIENRYLRKDGAAVWVRKSVSLVRDTAGRPKWFMALVEDIRARKSAEQALNQANQSQPPPSRPAA